MLEVVCVVRDSAGGPKKEMSLSISGLSRSSSSHFYGKLVYKQRNNLLPDVFDSYFKPRNEIHNLQTRNAHKLNVIRLKNNYCKSTLKTKVQKYIMNCPII